MENASKALVIAGAILSSILLITIGVMVISSISGVTEQVTDTTSDMAAQTFNSQYTSFIGTQNGSNVRSLLNKVISNNSKDDSRKAHEITVEFGGSSSKEVSQLSNFAAQVSTIKSYTVEIPGYTNGYVSTIKITQQ